LAVIQAYFDCSGYGHDPGTLSVILAGYVATEDEWKGFAERWNAALSKYGLEYFHMKEFFHGRLPLSEFDAPLLFDRLTFLLSDCFKLQSFGICCQIPKQDYEEAKALVPRLPPIEQICGDVGTNAIFERGDRRVDQWQIFYDSDESKFFRQIKRHWDNKALRRAHPFLATMVGPPQPVNMRKVPALQAADILAWTLSRDTHPGDIPGALIMWATRINTRFVVADKAWLLRQYSKGGAA
jgi:hypothetical protein